MLLGNFYGYRQKYRQKISPKKAWIRMVPALMARFAWAATCSKPSIIAGPLDPTIGKIYGAEKKSQLLARLAVTPIQMLVPREQLLHVFSHCFRLTAENVIGTQGRT